MLLSIYEIRLWCRFVYIQSGCFLFVYLSVGVKCICASKMFSVCACVWICVCVHMWLRGCACMRVCVYAHVCVCVSPLPMFGRLLFLCPVFGRMLKHWPFVLGDNA